MSDIQTYTSPQGDLLIISTTNSVARLVRLEHVAEYEVAPHSTPAEQIENPLHLRTLLLAHEMGLEFEVVSPAALTRSQPLHPPVVRLRLGGKIEALLVPLDLTLPDCSAFFADDPKLSLVVGQLFAFPRTQQLMPVALRLLTGNPSGAKRRSRRHR